MGHGSRAGIRPTGHADHQSRRRMRSFTYLFIRPPTHPSSGPLNVSKQAMIRLIRQTAYELSIYWTSRESMQHIVSIEWRLKGKLQNPSDVMSWSRATGSRFWYMHALKRRKLYVCMKVNEFTIACNPASVGLTWIEWKRIELKSIYFPLTRKQLQGWNGRFDSVSICDSRYLR